MLVAKGAKKLGTRPPKFGLVKPLKVGITRLFGVQRLTENLRDYKFTVRIW